MFHPISILSSISVLSSISIFRPIMSAFVLAILSMPSNSSSRAGYALEFIGQAKLKDALEFKGTIVGGLSGIDYNKEADRYYAISDDRARPRFYELSIDLGNGEFNQDDIKFLRVVDILDENNKLFSRHPDPESIRISPFPNLLYWSSERLDKDTTPFLRIMTLDGHYVDEFELPEKFIAQDKKTGTRNNVGFESLSLSTDSKHIIVANESALVQDGEQATLTSGSAARVLVFDRQSSKTEHEYIYDVGPIAKAPVPEGALADNGLVELLALDHKHFIAMERSFSKGLGFSIKLFLTSTRGATDVSNYHSIKTKKYQAMKKTLLLDLNDLGFTLDNLEGMTLGPEINGKKTLILISDNNFNKFDPQVSQFIVFSIQKKLE